MHGFDPAIETSKLRLLPRAGIGLGGKKMIQLLFTVLVAEAAATAGLLFNTPLRKLLILGLDRLKRGRSTVMVKTLAATAVLVLASSIYSMAEIRLRFAELGAPTPTDQILMSRHLLEASLLGMGIHSCYLSSSISMFLVLRYNLITTRFMMQVTPFSSL